MRARRTRRGFAALDAVIAAAIAAVAAQGLARAWSAGHEAARRADWLQQAHSAAQTNLELHWREAVARGGVEGRSLDDRFGYRITAARQQARGGFELWRVEIAVSGREGRRLRLQTRRVWSLAQAEERKS
jgi:hypothetical protein